MTRYKRSGSTQKHRKMPLDASSWKELKNSLGNSDSPNANSNEVSEKKSDIGNDETVSNSKSNFNKQRNFHSDDRNNNRTFPNHKSNFNKKNLSFGNRGNNEKFQNSRRNFNQQGNFNFDNRGSNKMFPNSKSYFNKKSHFNSGNGGYNESYSNSEGKFKKQQNFHFNDNSSPSSKIGKKRKLSTDEDQSKDILADWNIEDAKNFNENPMLNKSNPNKRQKHSFEEQERFAGNEINNARDMNVTGTSENNLCLDKSVEYTPSVMSKRQMRKQKRMMKLEERKRRLDAEAITSGEADTKNNKSLFSCPWDNLDAAGDNSSREDIIKQQQGSGSSNVLSKKKRQMQKDKADENSTNKPSKDKSKNQDEGPLSKKQMKSAKRKMEWLLQHKSKRQNLKQNKLNPQELHETESAEASESHAKQEDPSPLKDNLETVENSANIESLSLVSENLSKRQQKKLKKQQKFQQKQKDYEDSKSLFSIDKNRDGTDSFDASFIKIKGLHTSSVAESNSSMSEEVKNNAEECSSLVDNLNQPKNIERSESGDEESNPAPVKLSKRQQKKLKQRQKLEQEEKDAYEDASFGMDDNEDYPDLNESTFVKAEDPESENSFFNMLEVANNNDGQNPRVKRPFVSARGLPKGDVTLPPHFEERLRNYKSKMKMNGYVEERIERIIKKERRHQEIIYLKAISNKPCFNCRKLGHLLADCPLKLNNARQETGICFKCGASDHISSRCKLNIEGYPFAKCFICKEEGHISRDCPKNDHGIYVDGGKCSLCGNVNHLKKDCPSLKKKAIEKMIAVHTINDAKGIDEEILDDDEEKVEEKKTIKKGKVVKF